MNNSDPSKFTAPRFTFDFIRAKADDFRKNYWPSDTVPVDVLLIAEEKLNLNIVPIKNFKSQNDIEALLYDNGESLAVDETEYMDDRYLNRIRYSVAHEIGHLVLHKDLYDSFNFSSVEEWIETLESIPEDEYNWIEQQAYEFAGRLLVPVNKLESSLKTVQPQITIFKKNFPNSETNSLKEHISTKLCKEFGVSYTVILKRFDKEKLDKYF